MSDSSYPPTADTAPEPRPRRRRWVGPFQILVVATLVLLAFVYARQPDDEAPALEFRAEDSTPQVRVIRPLARSHLLTVRTTGSVRVRNHVSLATQVTGSVVSIAPAMRAGGTFRAGEELLAIDPRDFRLAVEQAQADIEVAQSGVLLEQARSDAARSNYAILHPDKEVPSLVARVPQIAQAKAQRAAARARLRVAELSLERTVFSLPFDGSIVQSNAEVGQVLTRGQPFGRAFAHDAVEVVALLAPDDLKRIEPATGRQATVDDQNRRLAAVVERTSAELDARTRFAELYLRIDGTPPTPGTFVDVEIQGPALANTFLLPDATEQVNGDAWIVADGKLEGVRVEVLGRTGGGRIVRAFDIGSGIVVGAVPGAMPGQAVEVDASDSTVGTPGDS